MYDIEIFGCNIVLILGPGLLIISTNMKVSSGSLLNRCPTISKVTILPPREL